MSQSFYRWTMAFLAAYAALCLPTIFISMRYAYLTHGSISWYLGLVALSLALLPISLIGLWSHQGWGSYVLCAAMLIGLVMPPIIVLHLIAIGLTLLRYHTVKAERQDLLESGPADGDSPASV